MTLFGGNFADPNYQNRMHQALYAPCAINRITLYYLLVVVNSGVFWLICTYMGKVKLFLKMYVNHNKTRIMTQILEIRQLHIPIGFETRNLGSLWSTTTFAFHCRKVWTFYYKPVYTWPYRRIHVGILQVIQWISSMKKDLLKTLFCHFFFSSL